MTQNAVDFLPEDYVEKRAQQRTAILFTGLFVAVMGGIIGFYMFKQPALRAAQAEATRLEQELDTKGKQLLQVQEMEREKQKMMNKAEVTALLLERVPRSVLLADLTRMLPKGVSILTLDLKSKDAQGYKPPTKLEQASQAEHHEPSRPPQQMIELNLMGIAPTDGHVATFIESMGKSKLLVDVNLLFSEEHKLGDQMLRRFKVEMKLNPEADIRAGMTAAER